MNGLRGAGIVAGAVVMVGLAPGAQAAAVQTSVTGSLGKGENACLSIYNVLFGQDCSYANDRPALIGWMGPVLVGGYYEAGSQGDNVGHLPTAGDGKIAPTLAGTVTIDDGGTPGDGADDTVAAAFAIGPAVRNVATGNGRRTVERWESLTHTMAATGVSSATANAQGGFDYVIGLQGFPQLLCLDIYPDRCFGGEHDPASSGTDWAGPEPGGIGIERNANQGGNLGAVTSATFTGYSCADNSSGADCTGGLMVWGAGESPGFDNLLLRIATNAAGHVVDASGFWTQEFRISSSETQPGDNSWHGGTLAFGAQVVPLPGAAWLFVSAFALLRGVRGPARRRG